MDPDELLATLASLQTTVDGLSDAVDSMSDMMDYNFSQLVGHGQGQTQNAADNATTTSTSPSIAQHDAGAGNIVPPSLFGQDNFGQLFDNLTRWFEESMPSLIGSASAGEANESSGGGQFDMQNYLNRTREIESSNGTNTGAPNALAQGDFQFIPSTWEDTKKRLVDQGHPEAANWTLDDRNDPEKARIAAENLAEFNRTQLQRNVRGEIGEVETYSAHLLGASGASALLNADPNSLAKDSVSESALRANEAIFKDTGVSIDKLTAKQLIDSIAQFYGGQAGQRQPSGSSPNNNSSVNNSSSPSYERDAMQVTSDYITGNIKKLKDSVASFGVNTVGPERGANVPPDFSVSQGRNGMPPPRGMMPSATTADDSVSGGIPSPSSNNPIFDFFNHFGVSP
jgi:hypothetical protein